MVYMCMVYKNMLTKLKYWLKITAIIGVVGGFMVPNVTYAQESQTTLTVLPHLPKAWHKNYNPFSKKRLPTVRDFMFEPLIVFERNNKAKPNFRLASSYKYNSNNMQLTIELRPDLKWSDGRMLTADDVVFTFNLFKDYPSLDENGIWTQIIQGVAKLNSRKVIFNLKRANSLAHIEIGQTPIVPMHIWGGLPRLDLYRHISMVGSGPLTQIKHSPGFYTQCRNPHYWDNASLKIDCIKVPRFTSMERLYHAVSRMEIDWMSVPYQDIEKKFVTISPQYYRYKLYDDKIVGLMFNYKTKHAGNQLAFNSPELKRAISMALKRRNIISIGTYDTGLLLKNLYALPHGLVNWYDDRDDIKAQNEKTYTRREITAMLLSHNFSDVTGDGWINNVNSTPIDIDISVPDDDKKKLNVARIITENLRHIGIHARVKNQVAIEYPNIIKTGHYETAIVRWDRTTTPFEFYLNFYSKQTNPDYRLSSGFDNFKLDEQLLIYHEQPADKIVPATMPLAKAFYDALPMIPLYTDIMWHQYSTQSFTGWDGDTIVGSIHPDNPERLLQLLKLSKK